MKVVKRRVSLALALLAGFFLAAPSAAGGSNGSAPDKITVCHKGKEITVGPLAAAWHALIHGDRMWTCDPGGEGAGI